MITEKLNDVFTPLEGGIFHYLQDLDVPWDEEEIDNLLDMEYHYNTAGQRFVSPLVHSMIDDDTGVLDDTSKETLAGIIYSMYGLRWAKLWATMGLTYNPIENYSMTEEMRNDITETDYGKIDTFTHGHTETETLNKTDTITHGTTETLTLNTTEQDTKNLTDTLTLNTSEQDTKNLSDTETPATSETSTTEAQGFNSSAYQPSERTTTAKSGTDTTTHTGTDTVLKTGTEGTTHTGTDTTVRSGTETTGKTGTEATAYTGTDTRAHSGQDMNAQSGTDTTERNYTLTRSGNIGVTTSQQMIESERKLWMWDYFKEVVFPDINRVLTLSIY